MNDITISTLKLIIINESSPSNDDTTIIDKVQRYIGDAYPNLQIDNVYIKKALTELR